ncbi:hypothetical protein CDAR_95231 [Caerostris darwini]|uniref:Uncharacterized protein n=1 Tax=Caerostris darwini TaxID=1538125 RepID=A0AAV4PPA6_9ARAC|nr:hypothetical protein CDAR_95231 [Caerostris darwini]
MQKTALPNGEEKNPNRDRVSRATTKLQFSFSNLFWPQKDTQCYYYFFFALRQWPDAFSSGHLTRFRTRCGSVASQALFSPEKARETSFVGVGASLRVHFERPFGGGREECKGKEKKK